MLTEVFVTFNCLALLLNMTELDLKERLEALEAQRRQMEANLNAIAGAMQECQYWLQKIADKPEQENVDAN